MVEVYSGICGEHLGRKSRLKNLTTRQDCESFRRKCKPCQVYILMNHKSSTSLSPTTSPCPFFILGMDLAGPLPKSTVHKKFIIVAIDYHTKCVEEKSQARIREIEVIEFFMEFTVSRFEVPHIIVTNNKI